MRSQAKCLPLGYSEGINESSSPDSSLCDDAPRVKLNLKSLGADRAECLICFIDVTSR